MVIHGNPSLLSRWVRRIPRWCRRGVAEPAPVTPTEEESTRCHPPSRPRPVWIFVQHFVWPAGLVPVLWRSCFAWVLWLVWCTIYVSLVSLVIPNLLSLIAGSFQHLGCWLSPWFLWFSGFSSYLVIESLWRFPVIFLTVWPLFFVCCLGSIHWIVRLWEVCSLSLFW